MQNDGNGIFRLAPNWDWNRGMQFTRDGDALFPERVSIGNVACPTATPCGNRLGINNLTLAVGGRIGARYGIHVVAPTTVWPDYVFGPGHQLMPLNQVAQYVHLNGHLPDVPSASQVAAEGIELSSMQAVLLRKVEELTLHLIELNRENEQLKARMSKLEH